VHRTAAASDVHRTAPNATAKLGVVLYNSVRTHQSLDKDAPSFRILAVNPTGTPRRTPEPAPFTVSVETILHATRPDVPFAPAGQLSLSRASWVERAQRPLWLYRQAPGDRARRSVLSEASTVRRVSWRALRASVADLLPGYKRFFSEAPAPQPARPSVMSQQLKSRTRQVRGSTAAALPQQTPISFGHSIHTQYPWMVVLRALRANYDRQPGRMRFLISAERVLCNSAAPSGQIHVWDATRIGTISCG
jgi:hypothetical protein